MIVATTELSLPSIGSVATKREAMELFRLILGCPEEVFGPVVFTAAAVAAETRGSWGLAQKLSEEAVKRVANTKEWSTGHAVLVYEVRARILSGYERLPEDQLTMIQRLIESARDDGA